MNKKDEWNKFKKTGKIEDYLEYKGKKPEKDAEKRVKDSVF